MSDKKFTPREAAQAVLKKAEELYRSSSLAKAEKPMEKKYEGFKAVEASAAKSGASDPAAVAAAAGREKYGKEAFQHAAASGKKMGKSDEAGHNPDEKADAQLGEKIEQDVHSHEEQNSDPAHEAGMKGHIKLAKFVGRMELKKSQKAQAMGKTDAQPAAPSIGAPAAPAPAAAPSMDPSAKGM